MKKQLNPPQKIKLSLKEFIWYAFNFMVGVVFVSYFAVAANFSGNGMGINVIWVWALDGIFATVCAMSFAKMSRVHEAGTNGAAYVYTRSTFGKTTGLLVGFIQYLYLPFSLSYQMMSAIRVMFASEFQNGVTNYAIYMGSFTDLWLDLIAIALFIGCALVVIKGATWYKKISRSSNLIKWIAFSTLIILAIYLSADHGNGAANLKDWSAGSKFTLTGFTKTFNSCFFAFIGFELFATAGKNVQNAQKNVSRGIMVAMLMSIIAYLALTVVFFAAISPKTGFAENFNLQLWFTSNLPLGVSWAGCIIAMISIISMRIFGFMQKTLFGGTTLQPLSYEGFFPDKFGQLNHQAIPVGAAKLNLIIVVIMGVFWLIIPDIIKGSMLTANYGFIPEESIYKDYGINIFNVQALSSFASIIAIFVYMMVILATLTLAAQKKIKISWLEYGIYSFTLVFLAFICIFHYYNLIDNLISHTTDIVAITAIAIEGFVTIASVGFFYIWKDTYYKRKIHTRTVYEQREKDKPFRQLTIREKKILEEQVE